jgi:hypothetical protein
VSAPCRLILENWNIEKMQHVMQTNGSKKCKQKATAERKCKKKESQMHKKCKCKNAMQNK